MFDFTSSKLLLLAIVALLVIGPKDLPALLRAIGKYVGIVRGHAREFRAQFDEAMRESELTQLKKDMENIAQETEASLRDTGRSVEQSLEEARRDVDTSLDTAAGPAAKPVSHDAGGLPLPQPESESASESASNAPSTGSDGDGQPSQQQAGVAAETQTDQQVPDPARPTEKSGA